MKNMKKALCLFLALVMCLGMLPVSVFAAETPKHEHNQDGWVCKYTEPVTEQDCKHTHDETCGYVEAKDEVPCDCGAEPDEETGEVTHTEDCAFTPAVEGKECDHVCDDACVKTVTEGFWTCTAPVVKEETPDEGKDNGVPAEVKAFLAAVAALPDAETVTAENAEAIGAQVNEALGLYDAIDPDDETEEVAEALETVYAVFEAVLAAEEIEESGTYEVGASEVVKSADSEAYPQTSRYNVCGDWSSDNWAEPGYGQIYLAEEGDSITDDVFMHYYRGHNGVAYPLTYTNLGVESNSNPGVATASVTQENGHIKVTFTKGSNPGSTTIVVGYTCQNMKTTVGLATDSDWYCAVSGQLIYTVSDGKASAEIADADYEYTIELNVDTGVASLYNGYYGSKIGTKNMGSTQSSNISTILNFTIRNYWYNATGLRIYKMNSVTVGDFDQSVAAITVKAETFQDPYYGDEPDQLGNWPKGITCYATAVSNGKTDVKVHMAYSRPYVYDYYDTDVYYVPSECDVLYHVVVKKTEPTTTDITLTYHDGSLTATQTSPAGTFEVYQPLRPNDGYTFKGWAETEGSTTVKWEAGKEYTFDKDTDLYAVWEAKTYTVIYRDSRTGSQAVFSDETHNDRAEGTATPVCDNLENITKWGADKGLTFKGWKLTTGDETATNPTNGVSDKVYADDANADGEIIYTAQWEENAPTAPTKDKAAEILNGKYTVKVICTNDKRTHTLSEKAYEITAADITSITPTPYKNAQDKWEVEVSSTNQKFVDKFKAEANVNCAHDDVSGGFGIKLVWNGSAWTYDDTYTREVETACHPAAETQRTFKLV